MDGALELHGITVTFGGLTALSEVSPGRRARHGARRDRPQRRRQDDAVQRRLRLHRPRQRHARWRGDDARPASARTSSPASASPAPCRASGCSPADRAGERRWSGADRHARPGFLAALLGLPRPSRDERRLRERAMAMLERPRRRGVRRPLPRQPALPGAEAGRPGAGAGRRARPAAARRARQRPVQRRDGRARRAHPRAAPADGRDARRAPHGPRDEGLRPDHRARLRQGHRQRHAGRGPRRPGGPRGLPRRRRASRPTRRRPDGARGRGTSRHLRPGHGAGRRHLHRARRQDHRRARRQRRRQDDAAAHGLRPGARRRRQRPARRHGHHPDRRSRRWSRSGWRTCPRGAA